MRIKGARVELTATFSDAYFRFLITSTKNSLTFNMYNYYW